MAKQAVSVSQTVRGGQQAQQKRLRILIDARKIFDGGVGTYLRNLLQANAKLHDYTLLINPEMLAAIDKKQYSWFNQVSFHFDKAKVLSLDELFFMAKRLPLNEFDLYQTPFFNLPVGIKIPSVVTIHDLIQLTHPEKVYYPVVTRNLMKSVIRRASKVLTVSEASATELRANFSEVKDKLSVIKNVIDSSFIEEKANSECGKSIVGAPYLLAVYSNLKPHKGLDDLIKIFTKLKKSSKENGLPKNLKLVLVGQGIEELTNDSKLFKQISAASDDILMRGYVSEKRLVALYAAADALCVTSKVEGFCLPVIQAHSQSTPVITRPVPAIKELITENDVCAKSYTASAFGDAIKDFYKLKIESPDKIKAFDLEDFKLETYSAKLNAVYENITK